MKLPPTKIAEVRQLVLDRARSFTRPLLIGHVALECHMSLREAELFLEDMVADGVLRRATPKELHEADILDGFRPMSPT